MQAVAAEFSGYAGQFCCFFGKNNFKQFVSIHLFGNGLLNGRGAPV
jgi:hypothetical protein